MENSFLEILSNISEQLRYSQVKEAKDSYDQVREAVHRGLFPRQEIRTSRYATIEITNYEAKTDKGLYVSWILNGNGLPERCFILKPEPNNDVRISFGTNWGYDEIKTPYAFYPHWKVEISARFECVNPKTDTTDLIFVLYSKEGESIKPIGKMYMPISLRCTKFKGDRIIGCLYSIEEKDGQ